MNEDEKIRQEIAKWCSQGDETEGVHILDPIKKFYTLRRPVGPPPTDYAFGRDVITIK